MGQIWVESQNSKNEIPFQNLETHFQLLSLEQKEIFTKGFVKGLRRVKTKGLNKIIFLLSKNKELATHILNFILSKESALPFSSCQFTTWIGSATIEKLNREKTLAILNTCTKFLISKRKSRSRKKQIAKIAVLYESITIKGLERWPLLSIYEYRKQPDKSCEESLKILVETAEPKKEVSQKLKGRISFQRLFGFVRA